jgi:hypothetical protein
LHGGTKSTCARKDRKWLFCGPIFRTIEIKNTTRISGGVF